jgi:D-aminoacyl-tRNA deacylase
MHRKIEFWIITSTEDIASMNIRSHLIENYPFHQVEDRSEKWAMWEKNPTFLLKNPKLKDINIRLVLTDIAMVLLGDDVPKKNISTFIGADFVIFASRHKAQSALPALLTHSTGNWSEDTSFGGKPRSLCRTSARLIRLAYQSLIEQKELNNLDWPVDLEVNHHGPTEFKFPLIFMELGSSEENWTHSIGGRAVSNAIMNTIQKYVEEVPLDISQLSDQFSRSELYAQIAKNERRVAIGFGGVHYAGNFSKILDKLPISFIVPKYFVPELTENLIDQMINNTLEPVELAIIDWNSMNSATRTSLIVMLEKKSIAWKKRKAV